MHTGPDPVDGALLAGTERIPAWVPAAFATSALGAALLGADHTVRWANPALAELAARTREELNGLSLADLVHPDDAERLAQAATAQDGSPVRVRGEMTGRWLDVVATPAILAEGQPTGILLQASDASALVQATAALQVLSDNALDVVATVDAAGMLTWVSDSVTAALGFEPAGLVGSAINALVAAEDLGGLADVLSAGQLDHGPATRTVRLRASSGAYRYMSLRARPIGDAEQALTAVAMHDVTEELRAKRELARSEEQFRMAMHSAPEGMAVTDSQDRIVQVNDALCQLLGLSGPAVIGHRFREFTPVEEREQVDQWRDRMVRGHGAIERSQHRLVGPTSEVWVDHSVGIMRDDLGNPALFVHQFIDRTAARRLEADLTYRASHDVQTGLANRASLLSRLSQRLGGHREVDTYVGVLWCDIDNLKPINDQHGHLVGDAVIAAVAYRLERAVRRADIVARVGGDEFIIVLEHCPSVQELAVVAANVHAAASHPVDTPAGNIGVTITVGAVLAEGTADTDDALARADAALYHAKRAGRNTVSVEGLTA